MDPSILSISKNWDIIERNEHIRLLTENASMRQEIIQLNGNAAQLQQTIIKNNTEIEILKEENRLLKLDLAELKKDNVELKHYIQTQKDKDEAFKVKLAIQDVNRLMMLEKSLPAKFKKAMNRLRNTRNGDSHYLMSGEDKSTTDYKLYIIGCKLKKLTPNVSLYIDRNNTGLIPEIITYLPDTPGNVLPSQEDIDELNDWWTED